MNNRISGKATTEHEATQATPQPPIRPKTLITAAFIGRRGIATSRSKFYSVRRIINTIIGTRIKLSNPDCGQHQFKAPTHGNLYLLTTTRTYNKQTHCTHTTPAAANLPQHAQPQLPANYIDYTHPHRPHCFPMARARPERRNRHQDTEPQSRRDQTERIVRHVHCRRPSARGQCTRSG